MEDKKNGFTRYKITITSLIIFAVVAVLVVIGELTLALLGMAEGFSDLSKMIVTALVSFYVGVSSAYNEQKRIDG